MDNREIKALEARYWAGETSLTEEEQLSKMVSENHPEISAPLTRLLNSKSEPMVLGDDFADSFWDKVETDNHETPVVQLSTNTFLKYAAVGILVVATAFSLSDLINSQVETNPTSLVQIENAVDTYDDPQKAFLETKRALLFASSRLNKGNKQLSQLKKFNEAMEVAEIQNSN